MHSKRMNVQYMVVLGKSLISFLNDTESVLMKTDSKEMRNFYHRNTFERSSLNVN